MKKILTLLFLLTTIFAFSQKNKKDDTTEICFPYTIGQKILLDLNDFDKNKELLKRSEKEIILLNEKIEEKSGIIRDQSKTIQICDTLIKKNEEKFIIVNEENGQLKKDITNLKVKNNILNIVSGSIITGLTYIFIFK